METIEMRQPIPAWAKQRLTPTGYDFSAVRKLYRRGSIQLQLPDTKTVRVWAKSQGWPAPRFGFKEAFIAKMFESSETLALTLNNSEIELYIPIGEHILTNATLAGFDRLYAERSSFGQPSGWSSLVSELREIRRLVEAGVVVRIEGMETHLNSWQRFYDWAHGRYHALEDGSDSWIGDDNS